MAVSNLSDKEVHFREMYMQEVLKEIVIKVERQNLLIKKEYRKTTKTKSKWFYQFHY